MKSKPIRWTPRQMMVLRRMFQAYMGGEGATVVSDPHIWRRLVAEGYATREAEHRFTITRKGRDFIQPIIEKEQRAE